MRLGFRQNLSAATTVILLVLTSCSVAGDPSIHSTAEALLQTPMPKPDFIVMLNPAPGSKLVSVEKICTHINYSSLWELGDSEESIVHNFVSRVKLEVDGQIISSDQEQFLYGGPNIIVQDKAGKELGSIGIAEICFAVDLSKGTHLAKLQINTTSGLSHSYSWAFQIQ